MTGRLVLVGTPIGNLGDLSARARSSLEQADVILCEDTRRTLPLLNAAGISSKRLVALHQHNEAAMSESVIELVGQGRTVALVSDAGMPGISDPGERLVRACARADLEVSVVPGPSAVIGALVVSGLPADRFCFEGFLPRSGGKRAARLGELASEPRTAVLYEAPQRVARTLNDLARCCGNDRRVVLARELTKLHEEIWRGTLSEALDWLEGKALRGEWVIVLAGAPLRAGPSDDDIRDALRRRLAAGDRRSEAVAEVAASLGASRGAVYRVALAMEM